MIKAEIIKDSIAPSGVRLTTFVLTYPRFIHSEFMTHRALSRNASSSRAIPVKRQIEEVINNPAIPLAFTKNQKGMQGGAILDDMSHEEAVKAWLQGRDYAVEVATKLASLEVHKQYANRVLEPFAHIRVIASATDWANFFALRYHEDAQPEFQILAAEMYKLYDFNQREGEIEIFHANDWHLPYITTKETTKMFSQSNNVNEATTKLIKISVARCAKVSYNNHDGTAPTFEQDLQLYERLVKHRPMHASPTEHQAYAGTNPEAISGNFKGWTQYRKTLIGENITNFKKDLLIQPK